MDPVFCEFYVTCNPPLTPEGVSSVVAAIKDILEDEMEFEILYEPEIPWFKVVSSPIDKKLISDTLRKLLQSVVEEDADLVDPDQQQQHETPVDVKIMTEDSRVMPWSTHDAAAHDYHSRPDLYFPESMISLPQKRLWRGLETTDGWNIDMFYHRLKLRWDHLGNWNSPQGALLELLQCQISWNIRANLLYVGSDQLTPEAFEKAIRKLDNLLDVASYDWRSEHLIVTQEAGTYRFCFKYLTHVGQYRSTYLMEEAPEDHDPLYKAATICGESLDEDDQWNQIGPSSAPKKAGMKPGSMKVFGPFHDYEYHRKEPSAVSGLFRTIGTIVDTIRAPQVEPRDTSPAADVFDLSGVESWRDAVQQAHSREIEESYLPPSLMPSLAPSQPQSEPLSLIDLDPVMIPADDSERDSDLLRDVFCGPQVALGVEEEETRQQLDRLFLDTDDLICLNPTTRALSSTDARNQNPKPEALSSLLDEDVPPEEMQPSNGQGVSPPELKPSNGRGVSPPELKPSNGRGGPPPVMKPNNDREVSSTQATPLTTVGVFVPKTQKSHLLKMTETRVKELAGVLPLAPGLVSIELRFGRCYVNNLSPSQINNGHDRGPYFDDASSMNQILGRLGERSFGFSTALSACGPDMDDFVQMHPPSERPWKLCGTEAWYEVVCTPKLKKLNGEAEAQMVVEIDAKTFEYRCRGMEQDLGCVYLHCVQRRWDMQVCISQRASLHDSPAHMAVAEALAASLASTTRDGRLHVETTEDARLMATVDSVSVRHVARYRQADSNSLLTVAMVRKLDKGERYEARRKWHTSLPRSPFRGTPIIWYEASISSVRGRDMLAENVEMALGSKASYTCDDLEANGVFEDTCRPGLGIVNQMDDIGLLNDNGMRMAHDSHRTMIVQEKTKKKTEVVYW
ncbi:hypothetical protein CP533_6575 [Ophiocordyceps camponoti-saundersi (nom. inval.)]|nr:hypothetical protein CP533_6575 [Ophiocordyceps camponoti-saundersi (nom. inval.)]